MTFCPLRPSACSAFLSLELRQKRLYMRTKTINPAMIHSLPHIPLCIEGIALYFLGGIVLYFLGGIVLYFLGGIALYFLGGIVLHFLGGIVLYFLFYLYCGIAM